MYLHKRIRSVGSGLLPCLAIFCLLTGPVRAQSNAADTSAPTLSAATNVEDELTRMTALQSQTLAELQSQQKATLKVLEQTRLEMADALARNFSNSVAYLTVITEKMAEQRGLDLKTVRDTNRVGLAIIVGLSGFLLLSILFLNLTSIKAINRMTEMFSATSLMPGSEAEALGDAVEESRHQLVLFPGEHGQRQLGNAVVQLQGRIQRLEYLANRSRSDAPQPATGNFGKTPS